MSNNILYSIEVYLITSYLFYSSTSNNILYSIEVYLTISYLFYSSMSNNILFILFKYILFWINEFMHLYLA